MNQVGGDRYVVRPAAGIDLDTGRVADRIEIMGGVGDETDVAVVVGDKDEILGIVVANGPVREADVYEAVLGAYGDRALVTIGWSDGGNEIVRAVNLEAVATVRNDDGTTEEMPVQLNIRATVEDVRGWVHADCYESEIDVITITDARLTHDRAEHLARDFERWTQPPVLAPASGGLN